MNANTFLTNISKSLHTLEDQNNSLSITSDKNELKLQEIHKSIINLTTLIQQQSNSINGRFELIEENVDQLKLNQNNMLNNINEILSKVQQHPVKPNVFSTKSHKRKFKSVDDLLGESSESEAGNNSKLNPYDLTPTLVALVRNKMKVNERHDGDSDESIENEFSFDYSKSFTHRTNQKVLKAYLLFYMKDYESRGDNLKKNEIWSEEMIRQICNTYFGTRRNVFKSSPEKSKAIKINNRRNNRTLKKFNARNSVIDTFDVEILGHPIKEIKALFARELISPEISEDEATIKDKANDEISEEIYYVPSIPWRSNEAIKVRDIIDAKVKVEQQRQAKLRKGSVSGITTPNQRIPVSPNKDKFRQLVSFIPACPTSSNFPRWAIKKSYNLNTGIYNAVDSDSEYETINKDIAKSTQMNVDSVTEDFESDLTRSLNNFNNKVTNSERYSLLDNNNQIMTVSEEALLASSTRLDIELNNTCDQSLSKQVDRNANDQRDQELVKPPKPAPKTTKKRKSNLKPVFRNTRSRAAK
ncbi:unnamed protein product [Rhizophagus irregularis]|uniref:Uncharacterized protein n=1 Tax=Rhizophagus irregularis TaxID=588596 RepID=A0A915ZV92_9GLOM|nr:unnamed protein product [Rhizophagus irregularis]CAB5389810.1 unnamed protein product [Rhizophagus irregularis]